ncbi:MAG: DUF6090 family protein [Bacteroidota bacterium]
MINIFRRIRQQLAYDNKPVKYFRYAIGEIVLVVIGILIALSINNWNNKRIKENNAESLSIRLLTETKKNKKQLEYQIKRVKELQKETGSLLTMFGPKFETKNSKLLDSLLYGIISTPLYEYNSATLDEALNTGQISILQSDSLRTLLYDIPLNVIRIKNYEEDLIRDNERNLFPYLYKEISMRQMDDRFSEKLRSIGESQLKHFDNRHILSKKQFENMVDNKYFLLETLLMGYDELIVVFNKTTHSLEEDLNK